MTREGSSRGLILCAALVLVATRAYGYLPPTSGTHGNAGDFNYQLADGGQN